MAKISSDKENAALTRVNQAKNLSTKVRELLESM